MLSVAINQFPLLINIYIYQSPYYASSHHSPMISMTRMSVCGCYAVIIFLQFLMDYNHFIKQNEPS